ncbi:MAG: VWA domain-containing protein [Candidatus Omnitrophica bacterium]|nr:VWA domain-containing protein [Candidatus Omnitrophota bacterium]
MMSFASPLVLFLIPAFLIFAFLVKKRLDSASVAFPSAALVKDRTKSLKLFLVTKVYYLRVLALVLLLAAGARPQMPDRSIVRKEGVAVVLCIDCSSTMVVDDLRLSFRDLAERTGYTDAGKKMKRIDAVREVARDFILSRENDLIGIVAFAAEAFLVCPPTFDHEWLLGSLERVRVGLIKDGTAIGSGILASLNALREVEAKSKAVILLTDGINNFGRVPPAVAAKAARAVGVKIYTIGLSSEGPGLRKAADGSGRMVYRDTGITLDEESLRRIAGTTGGLYFRARDMGSLRKSYAEIDRLEKAQIAEAGFGEKNDIFQIFVYGALLLLALEIILSGTLLRKLP